MKTFQQAAVALIVIAVLSVLLSTVVHQLWPILLVGAILLVVYKVLTSNLRL